MNQQILQQLQKYKSKQDFDNEFDIESMSLKDLKEKMLGKGAFGAVYKLTSKSDSKTYALK